MPRRLRPGERGTAAILVGLVVLAYLWPALLGGGVLAPLALLSAFPPWSATASPAIAEHYNIVLSDPAISYYPWDVLARRMLHAGTFPAWNPYAFGGTPFFANASVAWLSPFSLPLWIGPLHFGLGFAAALKLWVAGFGSYLLARELRLRFWPGMLAAVSFALCAFNVVWLSHGAHVSVAALLPWTLWLAERIVRRRRPLDGVGLGATAAVVLTGGHPGTQLHVLGATVLYALVRVALHPADGLRERARALGLVAAGLAAGTLASAVVLLPPALAAADTVGAAARRDGAPGLPGATMPLEALRAALFPDWWGRPSEKLVLGPANYNERAFYAGTIAAVLAFVAVISPGAWRRKAPFALMAVVGVAVPLGTPLLHDFVAHLPLFDRVQNQRLLLWSAFAVALLGGFGLQAVLDAPRQHRIWVAVGAALFAGVVAVLTSVTGRPGELPAAWDAFLRHSSEGATDATLVLGSVGWWLLLILALAAVLAFARARPGRASLAGALVVAIAVLGMLRFADGYQPIGDAATIVPPRTPAIGFLQRETGDGRFVALGTAFPADASLLFGLRDARGYDAPQPSARFFRLWRRINPQQSDWQTFVVDTLGPDSLGVLGVLGTRHVLAPPGAPFPARRVARHLDLAYSGADATVFANRLAAPRAFAAGRVHVAASEGEEIATVAGDGFDPRRDVVVRADELGPRTLPAPAPGASVRVVEDADARVVLRADLPRASVVVLSDAIAPGWSVEVDGRPAQALAANVVVRGVVVPAGRHEIVWRYRVPGLLTGALLSALGCALLLAWAVWAVLRARRTRHAR